MSGGHEICARHGRYVEVTANYVSCYDRVVRTMEAREDKLFSQSSTSSPIDEGAYMSGTSKQVLRR